MSDYKLPASMLRKTCDPKLVRCETTAEIEPLKEIVGQERAVRALKFGLEIKERGFNIYVAGQPGTGRTTAVKGFLEELAKTKRVPDDWCYVNNFQDQYQPKALKLPPGKGKELQADMKEFIAEARRTIPKAFESEDYTSKRKAIIDSFEKERQRLISQFNEKAEQEGFIVQSTPMGIFLVPAVKGKPLSEEEISSLSPKIQGEIQRRKEALEVELVEAMRQLRSLERKLRDELINLDREVALYSVGNLITDLMEKYKNLAEVMSCLAEVRKDIVENFAQFRVEPEPQPVPLPSWAKELPFRKYEVNVIVDSSGLKGAPVVMELNPTYNNIFGRMEKEALFGALTTDFTMIRGGSLHKANGGYLVLPMEELMRNLFSWDSLKRAVRNEEIVIEEAGERLGFITTKSLRPEAIPLSIKIVLIGNPLLYHLLYIYDPDFPELFKIKAEFETRMNRSDENIRRYAAFICTICKKEKLSHCDSSAVAKIVEYGSRLAEDQEKISTRFSEIADIMREANFYAAQEGAAAISAGHVKKAIEEKIYRSSLIQERIKEMIERNVLLIDTSGEAAGQVNGLAVITLGDFAFGRPDRVTASIGLGREGLIDIEREAKLGGRIHTKGVMILSGYLAEKYAQDKPLTLSARLVFEQSYEEVEGDSASSTELYAILSALSGVPIKQGIAVTGSVNQKGEVQAIGGVNEKIEGYYEVCKTKGFTKGQGVLIPQSNVQNLMLKEEIVEAVQDGKFNIYAVRTIDQGIEVLTGVKAGAKKPDGSFESGSINDLVNNRLREMAEKLKSFIAPAEAEKKKD